MVRRVAKSQWLPGTDFWAKWVVGHAGLSKEVVIVASSNHAEFVSPLASCIAASFFSSHFERQVVMRCCSYPTKLGCQELSGARSCWSYICKPFAQK